MRKAKEQRFLLLALMIGIMLSMAVSVSADGMLPDYSQKGSITVDIQAADTGNTVSDGTMTLYKVASAVQENGGNILTFERAFEGCGIALSDIKEENAGLQELAASLEAYAKSNKVSGISAALDENGQAEWTDLELGLYLIVNTVRAQGYDTVPAFVITVPRYLNGAYVYHVNAKPKVGSAKASKPAQSVSAQGQNPVSTVTTGTAAAALAKLPQTGQLWWPVPVLAFSGMLLVLLGWYRRRCFEKSNGAG